jgi:HD-GYP domain-containing protein (c-di-GMP phosphodiesterase class II)
MRSTLIAAFVLVAAMAASGAALDDTVVQAQAKYADGDTVEALRLLASAFATNPEAQNQRRALADAYIGVGVQEYDRRNWKNAYECFKNALKLAPTDQTASKNFWKMKGEMDVERLKNEGPVTQAEVKAMLAEKSGKPAAAGGQPAAAGAEGTAAAQAAAESAAYKAALDKLSKTEQELESLRTSAASAASEGAALKTELERQKQAASAELERIRTSSEQSSEQNTALQVELARQKEQIDGLRQRMTQAPQPTAQDTRALQEMLAIYQKTLEEQSGDEEKVTRLMADQLSAQRSLMEEQFRTLSGRNWILIGAFGLFALVVLAMVVLIVRAQLRRRRAGPAASELYPSAVTPALLAAEAAGRTLDEPRNLLGAVTAEGAGPSGGEAGSEGSLYGDLLRAERIRRMHDQMKQGTLRWETVRDYTAELEKDLRAEILKAVEAKLQQGEGVDPRSLFPVLWPFLSDYDDYLRQKAESLIKRSMGERASPQALTALAILPAPSEIGTAAEGGEDPLGLPKLLEIPERLSRVLKDREKSLVTAKIARALAGILGLSQADADMVYRAAVAHDAGYLVLDRDKLQRILSRQEITEEDHLYIASHAKYGPDYFEGVKLPKAFRDVLLYHHERNDGSGYPKGLVGAKIPLFAKLVGLAETYVALTSERPYRQKLSPESALAVISDGAGRKFDREHIKALGELSRRSGDAG